MRKEYASRLTKKELINQGITDITKDGKVFRNCQEVSLQQNKQGYLTFYIYDKDEQGNKIKVPCNRDIKYTNKDGTEKVCNIETYTYKLTTIGVHRAVWAWYYGEVPQGLVIDHINNNKQDNRLENLQLLTQGANVMKEREFSTKEIKCRLNVSRSFYENKLFKAIEACREAQINHDAEAYHKARCLKYMACARLRYYDSHLEEAEMNLEKKRLEEEAIKLKKTLQLKKKSEETALKDARALDSLQRKALTIYKNWFKFNQNKPMWHQLCTVEKAWITLSADKKEEIFKKLENNFPQVIKEHELTSQSSATVYRATK